MFALKPTLITLYTLHTLFTVVFSATITIRVGDGGNQFVPNTVSVHLGDVIEWIWSNSTKGLHSVTQADKADSCSQLAGGLFAGVGILFIPCAVCIYWRCKAVKERKEIDKLNSANNSQQSSSSGGRSNGSRTKKRDNGPAIFFLKGEATQ
ncbi:3098_t:CDS:2 [Paraglomus occultum]|uniref:3098_t:CDS:1 n=1 Tax=Paraglomus occultum TaxID=144539 RepID=A0A9N9A732_9GLOM|nr:3098_t:CDS:2 [Paraglomus occultum]